ncbi:competence pheromone ComX [Salibacterium halotolerans]|uniref:ComX pheromone n=1 Tax=Salibacterium halotolerans TaxID=1884432 RepID=A0A1I5X358_9BACI|nr:competence pheromone ComX [Salibacterium halotolerans]SFQ26378.1 hypothetical protein SAMN05518683_12440 [Salibacterium halotolerans]
MLKKVVEQLAEQPQLLDKFKEDKLNTAGMTQTEKAAVVDVLSDKEFQGLDVSRSYWK